MKGTLAFDPQQYDYGRPTAAVRSIMFEWEAIDWFEPTTTSDRDVVGLFREHQRLAHAHAPDMFPLEIEVGCVTSDRDDFVAWCKRVQGGTGWDWKMSGLKNLSHEHALAHDWSFDDYARRTEVASEPARTGQLVFAYNDGHGNQHAMWNDLTPRIPALDALPQDEFRDGARFYIGYAHGDALDCIKWQLVEDHDDLSGNPFLPLLLCYGAGAYPFSLGQRNVMLFRFRA